MLANGYLALILRVRNVDYLTPDDLVDLIQHGDAMKFLRASYNVGGDAGDCENTEWDIPYVGALIYKCDRIVAMLIENHICSILNVFNLEIRCLQSSGTRPVKFGTGKGLVSLSKENWSRPYVGVIIRGSETQSTKHPEYIAQIVVAMGRATPAFLNQFDNASSYLKSGLRDVYGPGESYVFIGKRGWCVYDARDKGHDAFRLWVIETTHLVIMIMSAAARARRHFARVLHDDGDKVFIEVNQSIHKLKERGRSLSAIRMRNKGMREFSKAFAESTAFLSRARLMSPDQNVIRLIQSHLISHTARGAVSRCMDLTNLDDVDKACSDELSNYSAILRTAANYQRLITMWRQRRALTYGFLGVLISFGMLIINYIIRT